jgi:hypothetical protein
VARLMVIISLGVVVCGPPHGHYLVRSGRLLGGASWSLSPFLLLQSNVPPSVHRVTHTLSRLFLVCEKSLHKPKN